MIGAVAGGISAAISSYKSTLFYAPLKRDALAEIKEAGVKVVKQYSSGIMR